MHKEVISNKQGACILAMFILGNMLMYIGSKVKQNTWIAIFISVLMFLPVMLAYARIMYLHPGEGLFDALVSIFGKIFGRVFVLLYLLYAVHLGGFLIRFFTEFIEVVAMSETPKVIPFVFLFALGAYMVKSGANTLGRRSYAILPAVVASILITVLIATKSFDFKNLLPVGGVSLRMLTDSSFTIFASSFAETVLFTALFGSLQNRLSPLRVLSFGTIAGLVLILAAALRNILVLGFPSLEMFYFPSYVSVSVISFGDFFTRIEVFIGLAFLLDLFVKLCVCMFAASMGIAKLFQIEDYKKMAIPAGLLMMTLSGLLFSGTSEMFAWLEIYKYYTLLFQVILPIIVFIGAEIQNARAKSVEKARTR